MNPNDPCDPVQVAGYTGYDAGNAIWAAADCDSDGVTNGEEDTNGADPYLAPVDTDTDSDGIQDVVDNCPFIYNPEQEDFDNDGIGDVCDGDIDNDGILNEEDFCPTTLQGILVDENGCEIVLGVDNFAIKTTGESCVGSQDGSIEVITKEFLDYIAILTDSEGNEIRNSQFNSNLLLNNLPPDVYKLCFSIEGNSTNEQCYTLNVQNVELLGVDLNSIEPESTIILELSGANHYTVEVNEKTYTTTDSQITLVLSQVENSIKVSTDKDCQGTYEKVIILGAKGFVYPNPIDDKELTVYVGPAGNEMVQLSIFDSTGSDVSVQNLESDESGYVKLNMSSLSQGIYFLTVVTKSALANYKIIKK
ncbi:thrombospondin type 3 repeat-containing protein, partial [Croceitalea rosinachiae]